MQILYFHNEVYEIWACAFLMIEGICKRLAIDPRYRAENLKRYMKFKICAHLRLNLFRIWQCLTSITNDNI